MIEFHAHMKPLKVQGSVALRVVAVEKHSTTPVDHRIELVDQCMPEALARYICRVLEAGAQAVPGAMMVTTRGKPPVPAR